MQQKAVDWAFLLVGMLGTRLVDWTAVMKDERSVELMAVMKGPRWAESTAEWTGFGSAGSMAV